MIFKGKNISTRRDSVKSKYWQFRSRNIACANKSENSNSNQAHSTLNSMVLVTLPACDCWYLSSNMKQGSEEWGRTFNKGRVDRAFEFHAGQKVDKSLIRYAAR